MTDDKSKKTYTVAITGFDTQEQTEAFAAWYVDEGGRLANQWDALYQDDLSVAVSAQLAIRPTGVLVPINGYTPDPPPIPAELTDETLRLELAKLVGSWQERGSSVTDIFNILTTGVAALVAASDDPEYSIGVVNTFLTRYVAAARRQQAAEAGQGVFWGPSTPAEG